MTTLDRQPDDPGPHPIASVSPLIFGTSPAPKTDVTIRTIRRNAGKVAPLIIARALCWPLKRLQATAKEHGIDLRFVPEADPRGA